MAWDKERNFAEHSSLAPLALDIRLWSKVKPSKTRDWGGAAWIILQSDPDQSPGSCNVVYSNPLERAFSYIEQGPESPNPLVPFSFLSCAVGE